MNSKQSGSGVTLALFGLSYVALSLFTTVRAFAPISQVLRTDGVADGAFAGASVGELLVVAIIRGAVALPGLLLTAIALIAARYRARWFACLLSLTSICLLPLFPVGTAFGAFFLTYLLRHRNEFQRGNAERDGESV